MSIQPPVYRPNLEAVPILRKYIKQLKAEYKGAKIRRSITILQTIADLQEQIEWIENNHKKRPKNEKSTSNTNPHNHFGGLVSGLQD